MHRVSNSNQAMKRQALFINLYENAFPAVAKYVSRRGGNFDEARDVFQDALVIYYEKTILSQTALKNDIGYLVGTAKNLWLKHYYRTRRNLPLDQIDIVSINDAPPSGKRLLRFLETAGRKCMDLLRSFYYDQLLLQEIADEYGYSGIRSATVQKYKCLEKVREIVREKSLVYDDFME